MTPAESALIEATLTLDRDMRTDLDTDRPRLRLHALKMAVAQERMHPGVVAEFKESLRAKMRADRAFAAFASKLPDVLVSGTDGLTLKMWDEIEKEEGWA